MNRIFEFIPKKILSALLGLFILVQLVNLGLQRHQTNVINQTKQLTAERENLINEIKVKLETNQSYANLVHFLAIKTLFDQKKSILDGVVVLAQWLPKPLTVTGLTYRKQTNNFTLAATIPNPETFLRVAKYLNQASVIEVTKRTQSLNEKDNTVQIKIEGRLK